MSSPVETRDSDPASGFTLTPANQIFYDRFRRRFFSWKLVFTLAILLCALMLLLVFAWSAPRNFPVGTTITVRQGMTVSEIALLLANRDAIRSPFWFKAWSLALGGEKGIKAGEYYLSTPLSVLGVVNRLTGGFQDLDPIRVTIPEGLSNAQVAVIFSRSLKKFDTQRFLALAKAKEGYLFPDTYTFYPNTSESEIISSMEGNFQVRVSPLSEASKNFVPAKAGDNPLHNVVTMASLIEGEARTSETRKQISGILWHRLELGMPLQVDAVFPYILGKNTYEITTDDLKADSPYNTYMHTGLPPGPINNPGIDAITAAITPTASNYLYYLSDKDGVMHYATTHSEHLVNRAKYLGK